MVPALGHVCVLFPVNTFTTLGSPSVYIACLIRPLVETVFIGAVILGVGGGGKSLVLLLTRNTL